MILAESAIDEFLTHSRMRGASATYIAHVKGFDAVTVIRGVLANCPYEKSPLTTTELLFIEDLSDPCHVVHLAIAIVEKPIAIERTHEILKVFEGSRGKEA